jgi:hypothetical protein
MPVNSAAARIGYPVRFIAFAQLAIGFPKRIRLCPEKAFYKYHPGFIRIMNTRARMKASWWATFAIESHQSKIEPCRSGRWRSEISANSR